MSVMIASGRAEKYQKRDSERGILRPLCVVIFTLFSVMPGWAQEAPSTSHSRTPPKRDDAPAQQAVRNLQIAVQQLRSAEQAKDQIQALTNALRAYESGLQIVRDTLRNTHLHKERLLRSLDAQQEKSEAILSTLVQIQETLGTPAILFHPNGSLAGTRAAMIVFDLMHALEDDITALAQELEALTQIQAEQDAAQSQITLAMEQAQQARSTLSHTISKRTRELPERFIDTPQAQNQLLQNIETLKALAQTLPPSHAMTNTGFATSKGTLPLPVEGRLLRRPDEADAMGVRRPGIVLATQPSALVTAPWPVTIRYAGPLQNHGNVIVQEPEDGYLLIFAGLGEIYTQNGDVLVAGAPLGTMPPPADSQKVLNKGIKTPNGPSASASESLYIELRKAHDPIDPSPWFAQIDK